MNQSSMQFATPRMTPVVKVILIASGVIYLLQLLAQSQGISLENILGFVPARLASGWIWQPFTYAFLHAGMFHILFNLLVIWSIGCELEGTWGRNTFLGFFFVCAGGAALTAGIFSLVGVGTGPYTPVVGSSGVVYGLLLAYGILFGERTMYFFMLFPMPAKYFVMLLGGVALVSSVFSRNDGVAHLAHLGGMLFGFLFLLGMAAWRKRSRDGFGAGERLKKKKLKKAGHLRLVRGEEEDPDEPKHWN